jgi:triphosphoribosyl-dephospho-CoA synthetase
MNRNVCTAGIALAALLCLSPALTLAEELPTPGTETRAETRADVPALHEFHDVIRTIWHDAWPNKDVATLRTLLPDVQKGAQAVAQAELPGILREKKAAWGEGVKELETRVAAYAAAVEGTDDQALLDAAERLHAQFEQLVRVIRPALPELDAFHVVLYQLYHYDLPAKDLEAIRASVAKMKEPMAALNKASLSKSRETLQKEFASARKKLSSAVDRLASAAKSSDTERVRKAIEEMHDRYQALVAVFD